MIKIGDREVGIGLKPYVIAEAAIQHFGRVNTAKSIVRRAKRAGADAVKFQMFVPDEPLFCPLDGDETRWPRWQKSCMSFSQWLSVVEYCNDLDIDFLVSTFQHGAMTLLHRLRAAAVVKAEKVASRAIGTYPYRGSFSPFIISTGMGLPEKREYEKNWWAPELHPGYVLLQCKSQYPHDPYRWSKYDGLSDHSGSPWPAIHAMANGCALVELHVSFYTTKDDPDRASSITPTQLRLVCDARDNFAALRQD